MPGIVRAALLVLLLVQAWEGGRAQAAYGPLASRRILGGPVVSLDLPANDPASFAAATGVLNAASVRYGAEGPALDPTVPLLDFARPADRSLTLTGLTVGEALDAIARANPRLRWTELDGLIVVRMSNRDSFLDRRIRRLSLVNATPRGALEAIVRELAPERVSANGILGIQSTTAEVEAQLPPREGRDVSLSLIDVTLVDALNAIARENGALSWTVRYQHAPARISTAAISLVESRRIAVAAPPAPATTASKTPAGPDTRRIPVMRDIVLMLTSYARAAKVPIGVEQLPMAGPVLGVGGAPSLNLDGWPPEKAIALIVAHDSRYEWRRRSGRFLVTPKADASARALLDTPVPRFARSEEPFESVVTSLIERLGAQESRALPMSPTGPSLPAGTLDRARRMLVTFSLGRNATAREALEEICTSAGSLSWVLRPSSGPDMSSFRLEFTSPEGWQYTRTFSLPAPAASPARPRGAAVPSSLDRDIGRVYVPAAPDTVSPFFTLAAAAKLPIGIELIPTAPAHADPRLTVRGRALPPLGPGRFSDALYLLFEREPGYELTVDRDVLNIAPAGAARRADHVLNRPLGQFSVTAMPASRAVAVLRQRMAGGAGPSTLPEGPLTRGIAAIEQPVTVNLENATPRQILNEIVKQHGNLGWIVAYEGREAGAAGRVTEEDCVISLAVLWIGGQQAVHFGRDAVPRLRRPAAPPFPPSVAPGARRALLSLPVNDRTVESQVSAICRAIDIHCSVELVTPPQPRGLAQPQPSTGSYDFTGMTGPEALDKLVTLVPNLFWMQEGSIYRVRSQPIAGATGLPLDRRIDVIDRQLARLPDIFQLMRDLLDSSRSALPGVAQTAEQGVLSFSGGGQSSASRDRPISLKVRDVTIRQILDEVARQHGELAWTVRYTEANGVYTELMLTLFGNGWGTGQSIRIR